MWTSNIHFIPKIKINNPACKNTLTGLSYNFLIILFSCKGILNNSELPEVAEVDCRQLV